MGELYGLCAGLIMLTFSNSCTILGTSSCPHGNLYCLILVIWHSFSRQIVSCFTWPLNVACTTRTLMHLCWSLNCLTVIWRARPHKISMPRMYSWTGTIDTLYSQRGIHPTPSFNQVWLEQSVPQTLWLSLYCGQIWLDLCRLLMFLSPCCLVPSLSECSSGTKKKNC